MRAVVYDRYGSADVLHVADIAEERRDGIRVDVVAAGLNPKDVLVRKGKFRLLSRGKFPRSCGYDFAGVEVDTGREVFGMINGFLGRTCAERIVVAPEEIATRPTSIDAVAAASLPLAGLTALQALRDDGLLTVGGHVVVNGGSGGVGTLAIQIAKALGGRVTAICSAKNVELCASLGADEVLAYDEDDPIAKLSKVDVFFDVFGNRSLHATSDVLTTRGIFVSTIPSRRVAMEVARSVLSARRAKLVVVRSRHRDLETLARWVDEKKLRPVVERVYTMDEAADAHRHLETKRTRGKVVLRIRS